MIDKFSWSRVWFLIRRYFNENFRQLSMTIGVIFGIMLFFAITINKSCSDFADFSSVGFGLWLILFAIIGFSMTVSGSLTFSSTATKPKRIVAMMVPASKAEKFVSLLLIYNCFGTLTIVLCAFLADALTSLMFLHSPFFVQFFSFFSEVMGKIKVEDYGLEIFFAIISLVCGSLICSMATYTLGSSLWPKKSFLKTFCVMFAIQVFLPLFIPTDLAMRLIHWIAETNFDNVNIHLLAWGGIALIYIFSGLLYWLAWRRYRSTQLIQKFMMD